MVRLSNVLFLLGLLTLASCQNSYSDYDLTYNDSTSCLALCTKDESICTNWVIPITSTTTSSTSTNCYNAVYTYCESQCASDPYDTIGCSRCDNYKATVCPTAPMGQEYCDFAYASCYDDCNCIISCQPDYTFCERYLTELLSYSECKQLISAACYIPCRNGNLLSSPTRQQMYMQYCYDTFTTKTNPGCDTCIFPEYVPA